VDWIHLARDRSRWLDFVHTLIKLGGGGVLEQISDCKLVEECSDPWN
jgi:hypothetical protein